MSPEVVQFMRDLIFCAQNTYDPQIGVYAARAAKLLRSENPAKAGNANQGPRPASEPVGAGRFLVEREGPDGGLEYYAEDVHGRWTKNWREADLMTGDEAAEIGWIYDDAGFRLLSEVKAENAGCGL